MPRKSTARRITEGKDMISRYEAAGITNVWPAKKAYNFVNDMVARLERGRGWSKRQREYFDACVDAPTPVIQSIDPELEARLRTAAELLGSEGAICIEFADRLRGGKQLTEKQEAWANSCLTIADKIASGETFQPTVEQRTRMEMVASLRRCYNNMFWSTHPAMHRNLQVLEAYLSGERTWITEEQVQAAEKAVKGSLRKIDTPRFEAGSHGWLKTKNRVTREDGTFEWVSTKDFALICSPPYQHRGEIVYDVLVNGEAVQLVGDSIAKR